MTGVRVPSLALGGPGPALLLSQSQGILSGLPCLGPLMPAHSLVTSCSVAWFLTYHGLVPVHSPGVGDPCYVGTSKAIKIYKSRWWVDLDHLGLTAVCWLLF